MTARTPACDCGAALDMVPGTGLVCTAGCAPPKRRQSSWGQMSLNNSQITQPKHVLDPATIERAVLALVATSDGWVSAREIQDRLRLGHAETAGALRDLVRAGDLDWNGVVLSAGIDTVLYHLPYREVRVGRRMVAAS